MLSTRNAEMMGHGAWQAEAGEWSVGRIMRQSETPLLGPSSGWGAKACGERHKGGRRELGRCLVTKGREGTGLVEERGGRENHTSFICRFDSELKLKMCK